MSFGKIVQNGLKNQVKIFQIRDKFCIGQFEAKTSFDTASFRQIDRFRGLGNDANWRSDMFFFLRKRQKWVPYVQSIVN
jgi:hypothetical protein